MNKQMKILFKDWTENGIRRFQKEAYNKSNEIKNVVGYKAFLTIEPMISELEDYAQEEAYEQGFKDAMSLLLNRINN